MFSRFNLKAKPKEVASIDDIQLPDPLKESSTSVESSLITRRSIREYSSQSLSLQNIAQILWAAQGITHPHGYRTAPSAGALYPLDIYLLAGNVADLPPGIYKYNPHQHSLTQIAIGDIRSQLSQAALDQEWVEDAPAIIVISAIYERTTFKYGERGIRYVHMEVGSVAQNIYLQSISQNLGTVFVGAFHDDRVKSLLNMAEGETPLGIMPVGHPKTQ